MSKQQSLEKIKKRLQKECSICGRKIKVLIYNNNTYRGGHYFGKIPLHTKKAWKEAIKAGFHQKKLGDLTITVLNRDPKPYKHVEYWECPTCYWGRG